MIFQLDFCENRDNNDYFNTLILIVVRDHLYVFDTFLNQFLSAVNCKFSKWLVVNFEFILEYQIANDHFNIDFN